MFDRAVHAFGSRRAGVVAAPDAPLSPGVNTFLKRRLGETLEVFDTSKVSSEDVQPLSVYTALDGEWPSPCPSATLA
jgi:hypothetical protein